MLARRLPALLAGSLLSLQLAAPAVAAVEAEEVASRFRTLATNQGFSIDWNDIQQAGDDFVLKGVTVGLAGQPERIDAGDVQLNEVTELDNADYRIGEAIIPAWRAWAHGAEMTMSEITMTNVILAGPASTDPLAGFPVSDTLDIGEATVSSGGKPVVTLNGLRYAIERSRDGKQMSYVSTVDGFNSDLSMFANTPTGAVLAQLDLLQAQGSIVSAGEWSLETGDSRISQMDFIVDDAGTLGLTLDLGGYTQDLLDAARQLNSVMADASPEQRQGNLFAAMGLMQQLVLNGASLRYDDDSLAPRALSFAAATQGASARDLPAFAQFALPMAIGRYLPPDMVQSITAEAVKFIQDPKSLEIRLAPAEPIPFVLLGMGAADPKSLAPKLGLSVTANR